jgi:hypothetical protein
MSFSGKCHSIETKRKMSDARKKPSEIVDGKKPCHQCGKMLPISDYHRKADNRDGLATICRFCRAAYEKSRQARHSEWLREYTHRRGIYKPMEENKSCPAYLGIHIAERVLAVVFNVVKRMPNNNQGYDFICAKGFKIDVKSAARRHGFKDKQSWRFNIRNNAIADYFLCIGFDDRDALNPEHIWLIPGSKINHLGTWGVTYQTLNKWKDFEKTLDRVLGCCDEFRSVAVDA